MPMYDRKCTVCAWEKDDCYEPREFTQACPSCGQPTERVWLASARSAGVIDDSIPGGMWIENLGNTWRKFYSKSDILKAAKEQGLEPFVRHQPSRGSDKSKFTTRWV
jgi:hypothetical protein